MRRPPPGPSCRRSTRFRIGLITATLAALTAIGPGFARAQGTRKAAAPPDQRPLARYVPRDNLIAYLGSEGLDAQPEAWKKTAAYKLLNETNLGVMLEDMTAQASAKALEGVPNHKLTGSDVVAIGKHMATYGFVLAMNQTGTAAAPTPPMFTFVVRSIKGRDAFAAFARLLGTAMGATRPQTLMKGGRYIVLVPIGKGEDGKPTSTWAYWVEKDADLVVAIGKGAEDVTMAVIDARKPNAVDHPVRNELARSEGGFLPLGQFFIDPTPIARTPASGTPKGPGAEVAAGLAQSGLTRFDFRWGFQDEALMSITRFKAPRPRRGLLAYFDQPAFEKGKLPPLPEGIESFTVASVDFVKVYDQVMASPPSPTKAGLTKAADDLKAASRVDLRKDLLAHLAPKFALYVMPGAAPAAAPAAVTPAVGAVARAASPLGGLLGVAQLPRFTLAAEVDDNAAFIRTLDNLMVAFNKVVRDHALEAAEKAPAPKAESARTGHDSRRVVEPENGGSSSEAAKRRGPPPVPEFKPFPTNIPTEKSYVLNIPTALARQYPAGFRPTIRLKGKQLVVSTTPEAARLALEVKPGGWVPPADLAAAFEQLPRELILLGARDPRPTLPDVLAGLPGAFQAGVNAVIARNPHPGGEERAAAPTLVFKIPMTRLPKPNELRERLFPGSFAVSTDAQELRIVSRVAFPNIVAPSTLAGFAVALPAVRPAPGPKEVTPASPSGADTKKTPAKEKDTPKGGGLIPPD